MLNSDTETTSPSTPAIDTYSPTRNGFVKMMIRPAATLPSTPCIARAMPAPAMPSPATSGSSSTPRFCSATMNASASINTRTTRSSSSRTGGSSSKRARPFRSILTTQPVTNQPATRTSMAASNRGAKSAA